MASQENCPQGFNACCLNDRCSNEADCEDAETIILIVVAVIVVGCCGACCFFGPKMRKRYDEHQQAIQQQPAEMQQPGIQLAPMVQGQVMQGQVMQGQVMAMPQPVVQVIQAPGAFCSSCGAPGDGKAFCSSCGSKAGS